MPETIEIHISQKLQKILSLFDKSSVSFSEVMNAGRYRDVRMAMQAVMKLIGAGLISVALVKSTFVKV